MELKSSLESPSQEESSKKAVFLSSAACVALGGGLFRKKPPQLRKDRSCTPRLAVLALWTCCSASPTAPIKSLDQAVVLYSTQIRHI